MKKQYLSQDPGSGHLRAEDDLPPLTIKEQLEAAHRTLKRLQESPPGRWVAPPEQYIPSIPPEVVVNGREQTAMRAEIERLTRLLAKEGDYDAKTKVRRWDKEIARQYALSVQRSPDGKF